MELLKITTSFKFLFCHSISLGSHMGGESCSRERFPLCWTGVGRKVYIPLFQMGRWGDSCSLRGDISQNNHSTAGRTHRLGATGPLQFGCCTRGERSSAGGTLASFHCRAPASSSPPAGNQIHNRNLGSRFSKVDSERSYQKRVTCIHS